MTTNMNHRPVTVKLERIELCDLLLATTALDGATDDVTTKWAKLHKKLKAILDEFDKTHPID